MASPDGLYARFTHARTREARVHQLREGLRIGSSADLVDLVLPGPDVAPLHAVVVARPGGLALVSGSGEAWVRRRGNAVRGVDLDPGVTFEIGDWNGAVTRTPPPAPRRSGEARSEVPRALVATLGIVVAVAGVLRLAAGSRSGGAPAPAEPAPVALEPAGQPAHYDESLEVGIPVAFIARLDGRAAATAMAIPSERGVYLIAGSTAPWARGRGLYRALVRARWDYAVERGTPALVVTANPETSYPILKRVGFEDVCTITRLEDPNR